MPSVGLVLLVTVLYSYGYAEGIQHRFRRVQDISPDKEVSADPPSPYKLTCRLISRRQFEKLADRPWQPLEQELTKTPAPVKRPYAVRRMPGGQSLSLSEDVTLYAHVLGNLVVKDEIDGSFVLSFNFWGHFRSPLTGELYTLFTVDVTMMGGVDHGIKYPPKTAIFSRGKLLKNVHEGELFLSPDRRYILKTGEFSVYTRLNGFRFEFFPSYKEDCFPMIPETPLMEPPISGAIAWWETTVLIKPVLFDLQLPDLQEIELGEADNSEVESLFNRGLSAGCCFIGSDVWSVKGSPTSFILKVGVGWAEVAEERNMPWNMPWGPRYEYKKTYYLLFSLDDSGPDLDGSGLD